MTTYRIAVIGGTGPQGKGLGYRFARRGHRVTLGSRSAIKAELAAAEVNARFAADAPAEAVSVTGTTNTAACREADVVVLSVPWDGHDELVGDLPLAGRTVISCVNPIGFDRRGPFGRPVDGGLGSAAESAQAIAADAVVAGAFHHVSAVSLWSDEEDLDHEDVLVCGDSADAKAVAIELARCVTGRDGIDAGALRMARQLEPLTAVLISINRRYRVRSGIRISGL